MIIIVFVILIAGYMLYLSDYHISAAFPLIIMDGYADRLAAAGAAGHMSGGIQDLIMTFLDTNAPKY